MKGRGSVASIARWSKVRAAASLLASCSRSANPLSAPNLLTQAASQDHSSLVARADWSPTTCRREQRSGQSNPPEKAAADHPGTHLDVAVRGSSPGRLDIRQPGRWGSGRWVERRVRLWPQNRPCHLQRPRIVLEAEGLQVLGQGPVPVHLMEPVDDVRVSREAGQWHSAVACAAHCRSGENTSVSSPRRVWTVWREERPEGSSMSCKVRAACQTWAFPGQQQGERLRRLAWVEACRMVVTISRPSTVAFRRSCPFSSLSARL